MNVIRAVCVGLMTLALAALSRLEAQTDLPVFSDGLGAGWQNWSWASTSHTTRYLHDGSTALAVTAEAWEAAYFHHAALDASLYTNLVFWIHGGASGGQRLVVQGLLSGKAAGSADLPALPPNAWQQHVIPITALGVAGATDFDGFWIADRTGGTQDPFYLDDILLVGVPPAPPGTHATVTLTVNAALDRRPISPLIYGVAFATATQLQALNAPLNRSGGNSETRYNWQLNAHNRAADWYFESLADSSATPGAEADAFVSDSRAGGAEAMLTVPTLGWVARLGPNRARRASFSIAKYGAQSDADAQWFPDAGNGIRAADQALITGNDPNDANVPSDVTFQETWIRHLTNRWGVSAQGGVRYYFMDNEPSLWHSTHRDVHPTGATMQEVRDTFLSHAAMVKSVDPAAIVAGPEEWGWAGYFYSGFDQQAGAANGWSEFPDRNQNGGWDYLAWFLDQARREAEAAGRRLLDCFTVHYYPQGGEFSDGTATDLQLRRNRSTRSLWDPRYVDESWIGATVRLIPRLRGWIDTYYPGTRLGLTEYNWGAESHVNGATAQADLLGIFGREGLDLATRWTTPGTGTPVFKAIQMYRNYDGVRSTFGDTSVRAAGGNPDQLAVFAAERSRDGALTVMLVHKAAGSATPVKVGFTNFPTAGAVAVWQLTAANQITRLADAAVANQTCELILPAQSLTLLVVPSLTAPRLVVLGNTPEGTARYQLQGVAGQRYRVEESANLSGWTPVLTNTLAGSSLDFDFPANRVPCTFYRAVVAP